MSQRFLRTVPRAGAKLQGRFFQCRPDETGLSMFLREGELAGAEELPRFQSACGLPCRSPAVWPLDGADLEQCSLTVHSEVTQLPYGHLHHETDTCPDEDQAERLALLVTKRGDLVTLRQDARRETVRDDPPRQRLERGEPLREPGRRAPPAARLDLRRARGPRRPSASRSRRSSSPSASPPRSRS